MLLAGEAMFSPHPVHQVTHGNINEKNTFHRNGKLITLHGTTAICLFLKFHNLMLLT